MFLGRRVVALLLLASSAFAVCAPAAKAAQVKGRYVLAVLPSAPPVDTHTLWTPFVERLARDAGLDLRLKVYEKMADFERDLSRGAPDFLFSSPLQAVVAHQAQGYLPLVRGSRLVSAGIFVRTDSPIATVDDLAGKKIAFVGNKSFCSIFTRHELSRHRNNLTYAQEYAGSTGNVIKCVLRGKAEAGAAFVTELENEPDEVRSQLRTVLETPKVPPHPLGAHPRVPLQVREAVTRTVLALALEADGPRLFKALKLASPVAADYRRDYQSLEDVDVTGLSNWGK